MLNNMKIGKKLVLFFLIVAIISGSASVFGLCKMLNMNHSYSNALNNYGFAQGDIGRFNSDFNKSRSAIKDVILYTDDQSIQTASDKLDKINLSINQELSVIKKTINGEKEENYYNTIYSNFNEYIKVEKNIVSLAKENKNSEAFSLMKLTATPVGDTISNAVDSLMSEKVTSGDKIANELAAKSKVTVAVMLAVVIAAFVISVLIAVMIARSISKPIGEIERVSKELAEGNLDVELNLTESDNEIGQLGKSFAKTIETLKAYIKDLSFNLTKIASGDLRIKRTVEYKNSFIQIANAMSDIVGSMNDVFLNIRQAAEQVSIGSDQVSSGSQSLAQGATEQASSIEELSASIEDISTNVNNNASDAEDASGKMDKLSMELNGSNEHMREMITAMSNISNSSNEIGKIIKAIEDIAFQTNILALNAAVEAARAGKAGKGFAVVAEEVRNLAGKSAEAAKDTANLIQNSIAEVKKGTQIADATANSISQVVEHASDVTAKVNHISEISKEQANSIVQITKGMDQISSVVQTNSATAEESAASSEELSGQAENMKALVQKIKLR